MSAAILIDGGYLDSFTGKGANINPIDHSESPKFTLDLNAFATWCGEKFGEFDLKVKNYYHALPAEALKGATLREQQKADWLRQRAQENFNRIEKLGFTFRAGIVKLNYCRGFTDITTESGKKRRIHCSYVHPGQKKVDTLIVADIARLLITPSNINTIIIVSGDADLIPGLDLIDEYGKQARAVVGKTLHDKFTQDPDRLIHTTSPEYYSGRSWIYHKFSWEDLYSLRV